MVKWRRVRIDVPKSVKRTLDAVSRATEYQISKTLSFRKSGGSKSE